MSNVVDRATRSRMMSNIRGKDTKPELFLRRELFARGCRFRLHDKDVPGRPDIVNKRRKIAVFVDGCFWHMCSRHFVRPATNTEFWDNKIKSNVRRRREVLAKLESEGWRVFQIWECEIKENLGEVADILAEKWRQNKVKN